MIRTIILAIITIGLGYCLNTSLTIGGNATPPLGSFMSPFHGFWQNAESVDTPFDITLDSMLVDSQVEVIYDERLVPHIYGDDLKDVLYVQGYLHAKDRLWQMDIATRSAAGRLSEILGEKALEADLSQRRQGMSYAAENAQKGWSKFGDDYALLVSYRKGVNAYISSLQPKDYPLEFKLMNYAPEEWTELHSAYFMKNMAMDLCSGYADVENSNLLKLLGQEKFDYLFPEYNPKQSPIIPENVEWDFDNEETAQNAQKPSNLDFLSGGMQTTLQKGIGSNNWAVDGTKTRSGNPILCGDPHLRLTLPSIWYEVHLHSNDMNAYGVSLPGIPGILIGFNEDIAWTETNVGHDVWDFYDVDWTDESKSAYRVNGEVKQVTNRIEEIKVKGGASVYDTLKMTELGIITKYNSDDDYQDLAFHWLAHEEPETSELATFININKAKNYKDFKAALRSYVAPAQNFAFACRDGDIALHVNGSLPIKEDQAGRFISDGSKGLVYNDFIPRDELPQVHNPERGFIASANQNSTSPDYPYYYNSGGYFEQYRGRILNEKLAEMNDITIQDMMGLHYSAESLKAREAIPMIIDLVNKENLSGLSAEIISSLQSWDHSYDADSKAPSYFDKWWHNIYMGTFDEIYNAQEKMNVRYPSSFVLIQMLEEDQNSEVFDIESTSQKTENAQNIVQSAFDETIKELTEQSEKGSLEWHNYRKKSINHLANIDALSRKGIKAKGHGDALNAYGSTAGPSWRMVVSMDETVTAKVIYPGGQSGNPGSKYYDDMIDTWVAGEYYDAHFTKNKSDLDDHKLYSITFQ